MINITCIDDVAPFINGNPFFVHLHKEGYSVVDYVGVSGSKIFPDKNKPNWEIFRECRGLVFDETGKLLSRPLTKAFNWGERPEEDASKNWNNVIVTIKEDGSLIRPLFIMGGWRLGTRKGVTDTSCQAETFLVASGQWDKYVKFFEYCHWAELTPIFEFCSRDNRIVLDYPESKLVLLHIRELFSGRYLSRMDLQVAGIHADIPVVAEFEWPNESMTLEERIEHIRQLREAEGIVVQFHDTQEMVKIKAEDYCNLHRTKSYLDNERSIVYCLVNNQADDLRPLLSPNQLIRFDEYEDKFWKGFHETKGQFWDLIQAAQEWTDKPQKEFAVGFVLQQPQEFRPLLFTLQKEGRLKGFNPHDILPFLLGQVKHHSQEDINKTRWIFNARW